MSMNILKVQDNPPKEWQKYDLCLILPTEDDTCKIRADALVVIRTMAKILGRKYVYVYYSDDGMRVYALVRAGLKLLRAKAHSEKWKLLLDERACQHAASEGSEGEFINAFTVPHNPQVSSIRPFEHLYAEYNAEEELGHLYKCSRHSRHPFHKALRIKMLFDFFEKNATTDQSLSLEKLRDAGTITEMFGVHFLRERDEISRHMLGWRPQHIPEELLQHYFGEEITMYFSFLEHIFNWQLVPAIVGVAFQAAAITFDDYSRSEIPAFAFFLIFWNITAVQTWRRKQTILGMKWNTLGSDMSTRLRDHIRFQFHGSRIQSPIDGKETLFFPSSLRWQYYTVSFLIFAFALTLSLGGCGAIYYYARPRISRTLIDPYEQWVISGGTALQIMVSNFIYYYLALATTNWENHRLEKDFITSLSVKLSTFQIVNTLASSYYLAFAARFVPSRQQNTNSLGDCGADNCMFPLAVNVITIAAVRVLLHVLMKFVLPYLRYWIMFSCFGAYQDRTLSRQEAQDRGGAGDTTVVTITGNEEAPEMDTIYHYDEEGDVESTGGDTVLGRGSVGGEKFSGVSPLRSKDAAYQTKATNPDGNNRLSTGSGGRTRPAEATNQSSPRGRRQERRQRTLSSSSSRGEATSPRKSPPSPGRHTQQQQQPQHTASESRPRTRTHSDSEAKDDEDDGSDHDDWDDFDEDDDLVTEDQHADDDEAPRGGRSTRRSVNPDMARTMSSYMQQRQRQEMQELAAAANTAGNRNSRSLVRQHDEGGGDEDSDDANEIAIDPFKSFVYHNYDHVREHVTSYNTLLGLLVLSWTFGAALPAVFALVFVWLAVETRGQAWLLLYLYPRPVPRAAENIEPWLDIFDSALTVGILTNAGLIVFTMREFSKWSLGHQCALWIGIVLALLGYRAILRRYCAALPEEVIVQKQRNEFIEHKLVKRHPDVEDSLPLDML